KINTTHALENVQVTQQQKQFASRKSLKMLTCTARSENISVAKYHSCVVMKFRVKLEQKSTQHMHSKTCKLLNNNSKQHRVNHSKYSPALPSAPSSADALGNAVY